MASTNNDTTTIPPNIYKKIVETTFNPKMSNTINKTREIPPIVNKTFLNVFIIMVVNMLFIILIISDLLIKTFIMTKCLPLLFGI